MQQQEIPWPVIGLIIGTALAVVWILFVLFQRLYILIKIKKCRPFAHRIIRKRVAFRDHLHNVIGLLASYKRHDVVCLLAGYTNAIAQTIFHLPEFKSSKDIDIAAIRKFLIEVGFDAKNWTRVQEAMEGQRNPQKRLPDDRLLSSVWWGPVMAEMDAHASIITGHADALVASINDSDAAQLMLLQEQIKVFGEFAKLLSWIALVGNAFNAIEDAFIKKVGGTVTADTDPSIAQKLLEMINVFRTLRRGSVHADMVKEQYYTGIKEFIESLQPLRQNELVA